MKPLLYIEELGGSYFPSDIIGIQETCLAVNVFLSGGQTIKVVPDDDEDIKKCTLRVQNAVLKARQTEYFLKDEQLDVFVVNLTEAYSIGKAFRLLLNGYVEAVQMKDSVKQGNTYEWNANLRESSVGSTFRFKVGKGLLEIFLQGRSSGQIVTPDHRIPYVVLLNHFDSMLGQMRKGGWLS